MLQELRVNGLPETTDSLAWSEAGDLCIATNVKVHLYIPVQKARYSSAAGKASRTWIPVVLEVNAFSNLEWPAVHQQQFADFSIGEEESDSHVISCSWSVPGLALHDRCLFGILTANGLYSLWDADGDTSFTTSWKRILVVNRVIEDYFMSLDQQLIEVPAKRIRIRAGQWAKSLDTQYQGALPNGASFLALLNDQGEVILLKVEPVEETKLSPSATTVVNVLDLNLEPATYPDGRLAALHWSQWVSDDESVTASLTCHAEGKTWAISVQVDLSTQESSKIICAVHTVDTNTTCDWNTTPGELSLQNDQHLAQQHEKLKKDWEAGTAEGYPGFTRFYGTAEYKDFRALHFSFHPRTVIEYHIQAQEFSYIIFTHSDLKESKQHADQLQFDWEAAVQINVSSDSSAAPWAMMLSEAQDLHLGDIAEGEVKDVCAIVVRLYLGLAFMRAWQVTETSSLLAKLSGRLLDEDMAETIEECREESLPKEALQSIEGILDSFLGDNPETSFGIESCSICSTRLKWNGENGAVCDHGHQFDRCSLTLLAIQEPGISKFCSSCNREYIDKNSLINSGNSLRDQQFLSALLKAFPRCIYCEGILRSFS